MLFSEENTSDLGPNTSDLGSNTSDLSLVTGEFDLPDELNRMIDAPRLKRAKRAQASDCMVVQLTAL